MKHVLHLLNFAGKAGTETYVRTLIETIQNTEFYFAYNIEGLLLDRLKERYVPTFRLEMKSRFDIKAAMRLVQICRENQIDVVHTHYLREHYIALLAKLMYPRMRVVYTNHFVAKNDWITKISNVLLSGLMDRIVAVCHAGKDVMIANGMPRHKIDVVFNGIDPKAFVRREKSIWREKLGAKDAQIVLCASRFAHDKGHAFLIDAIEIVKKNATKPFQLWLCGDGPLLADTQALVAQKQLQDCVQFLGFQEDLKSIFDEADVYVNASQHEALSFLIVEAMANGLPVVVTAVGGNGDIVCKETGAGLIVPYADAQAMATAILEMLQNDAARTQFAAQAQKAANTRFHVQTMADAVARMYQEDAQS